MGELISASEAAKRLGVSRQRVWKMIHDGILPAHKIGNQHVIDASNLLLPEVNRNPGRPKKSS